MIDKGNLGNDFNIIMIKNGKNEKEYSINDDYIVDDQKP